MCAKFHHQKNLIISGSLDMTIRLWNFDRMIEKLSISGGIITQVDVELVSVIEAHDKGVNWVSFHPLNDLVLSAGDDRRVKVWKFSDSDLIEKETFFGHQYNVCCVEASPKTGQIVSNSEDCTLRVWDDNGVCIDTYTKNSEKQWMIDCHKNLPLIAVGTDKSLVILGLDTLKFKTATQGMNAFFVKDYDFIMKDLDSAADKTLIESLNRGTSSVKRSSKPSMIQANHFNKSKWGFIVTYNETKTTDAKVYYVEVDKKSYVAQSKQILAKHAVFIGKNKIAYLNNGNIELTDTDTLLSLGSIKGIENVDQIFEGGVGKIIIRTRSQVKLYDTVGKKFIGIIEELPLKKLKTVAWNKNNSVCALVCKKMIFLMNKNFQRIARINEGYKIQGSLWNKDNVLIYTTYNHVKYLMTNGDQGILKSLDSIRYPCQMENDILYCFDTEGKLTQERLDREDYLFKRSIQLMNIKKVKEFIKSNNTPGNSMISYLCKKNYPSVALSLAQDEKSKFQLAIRSGNLQAAYEAADNIKKKDCYAKLASEALKQGCNPLIEIGYQESQSYQKLAFLHCVTGNTEALEELGNYFETEFTTKEAKKTIPNLESLKFQVANYQSNMETLVKQTSRNVNLLPLSYLSAKNHGLTELEEPLKKSLDFDASKIKWSKKATALVPLKPLVKNWEESSEIMNGWPVFEVSEEKAVFEGVLDDEDENELDEMANVEDEESEAEEEEAEDLGADLDGALGDWPGDDMGLGGDLGDLDLESSEGQSEALEGADDDDLGGEVHVFVEKDDRVEASVKKNSILAADFASIGRFDLATEKLSTQVGIENGATMKSSYLDIYMSSQFFTSPFEFISPSSHYITKNNNPKSPYICNNLKTLEKKVQQGYNLTTKGNFTEAITSFREVISKVPLLSLNSKGDLSTAKKIIEISTEYIYSLTCDQLKKKTKDKKEILRLTIVMSLMNLQPIHRILTLRSALYACFQTKNYITSAFIARKLLKLFQENQKLAKDDLVKKVKKILAKSEKVGTNAITSLEFEEAHFYDSEITQKLNPVDMTFLGDVKTKSCPLTGAKYEEGMAGKVCSISNISVIGKEGIGLKIVN